MVARLVKDRLWGVWGRFYSGVSGRERRQGWDEETRLVLTRS